MNKISCFSFACNKEEKLCKAIRRDREKKTKKIIEEIKNEKKEHFQNRELSTDKKTYNNSLFHNILNVFFSLSLFLSFSSLLFFYFTFLQMFLSVYVSTLLSGVCCYIGQIVSRLAQNISN